MRRELAVAEIDIAAPAAQVWHVLTDSALLGEVMFGSEVVTDWQVGSPIVYEGEWEGKPFEDKGEIVELDEPRRIRLTHFSPLGGDADLPENYHEVQYDLAEDGATTHVTLTQDNNTDAAAAEHSRGNWQTMLESLKKVSER
ncbi:MAG: SRPBCC domain-containing protein [Pseudolysinimonas sp.]